MFLIHKQLTPHKDNEQKLHFHTPFFSFIYENHFQIKTSID